MKGRTHHGSKESFQTIQISELFHQIVLLVWQVCSNKAEFSFIQRKTASWCSFLKTHTKLTFGLCDIDVFAVFPRDGINIVGPLLPRHMILCFRENMSQCLKRFLGNVNVMATVAPRDMLQIKKLLQIK